MEEIFYLAGSLTGMGLKSQTRLEAWGKSKLCAYLSHSRKWAVPLEC